jgi:hypothetical protein
MMRSIKGFGNSLGEVALDHHCVGFPFVCNEREDVLQKLRMVKQFAVGVGADIFIICLDQPPVAFKSLDSQIPHFVPLIHGHGVSSADVFLLEDSISSRAVD